MFSRKNANSDLGFQVEIPAQAHNLMLPDPALLQYYKDTERRIFWLIGPVDANLYDLVQQIIAINYEDRNEKPENKRPIRIIMASPGGSLEIEQTLVAIMKASDTPIYTIAIGMCASAASMIYLAGHKRYATSNASFMFHQGGCDNLEGSFQQIVAFVEKYQMDIEEMAIFYSEHTKYPIDVIERRLAEGDWYISAYEALDNGVVDEIISDLKVLM